MKSQSPANRNSEPTSRNVNNIMILNKKEIQMNQTRIIPESDF